jgi:TonB-linked SusC/RagA family outer membrane protein
MKKRILKTLFFGLFSLFTVTLYAQVNVRGTVKSDAGELLPGVSIIVKGTSTGVITDIDGNYSISVPNAQSVLVFSFVGMQTQEVPVSGQSTVNVTLVTSSIGVNEVVVTALGISRERKSLGYSVGEVDGEALAVISQDNVLNSLSGKVAGVTINQTGIAGSTVSVVIRGANSLTTDNQPLFVIDGVPVSNKLNNVRQMGNDNQIDYGNAISDLNADDIAEMIVLKGPSAAALYGTRAGNGVILITTKSGKNAKSLGVTVSSNTLFETATELLDFHYKYANGQRNHVLSEGSAYWGGPNLDAGIIANQWGLTEAAELKSYPNNMKDFLNTGITTNNNIALNGGNDRGSFRISYNNMTLKGMIPDHDRFNNSLKTNIDYKILNNLTFTSSVTYANTHSNNIPSTGDRNNNPLEAVYSVSHIPVERMKEYWKPGMEGIQQNTLPGYDNPYFIAHAMKNGFSRDRIYGNVGLTYEFTSDLSVTARYSLDRYNETRETKIPFSAYRMAKGNYSIQNIFFQEYNADALATYKKKVSEWDFSVSAGGNIMGRKGAESFIGSGGDRNNGLVIPGIFTVGNIPLTNISVSSGQSEKAIYSVYGLASIGYRGMLYLDVTGRNDWSSTLPEDSRSYFYPSASLSWLVNNTFALPESISLLKFRGGWAKVGNDTDPYRLEPSLSTGTWNSLITQSVPGVLLNPNLKPEEATSIEGGIDFSMYNNRLRFSGTYYTSDNINQIFSVPLPRSSGYSSKLINAGLIRSEGWEITLGGTPVEKSNGLSWDVNLNFSKNSTTVEELTDNLTFIQIWNDNAGAWSFVGDRIGDIYSFGIAQVKDPNSPYYMYPILANNGQWINKNQQADWVKVGNFNPDFMMGMQTALKYKRWTVSASVDWRQGGEFVSYTYRYGESDWKSQRQLDQLIPGGSMSESELVAFLKANPEQNIIPRNGYFPRVGGHTQETGGMKLPDGYYDGAFIPGVIQTAGANTPNDFSDDVYKENLGAAGTVILPITSTYPWSYNRNITFDASFIKLRELSFSYSLPEMKGIKNASVSLYTGNLMIWTAAKIGIDPERAFQANAGNQGNTQSQFKQGYERQNVMPWSATGGVKLNFSF